MDQTKFLKHFKETLDANYKIAEKKNSDYSNSNDAFQCFKTSEAFGIPVEIGLLVRMCDKMSRTANLIDKEANVADEAIVDTLQDLANYATILKIYIEHEKNT